MKCFVALLVCLVLFPLARADEPDDQYITIYNLIQQGDLMVEKGDPRQALAKYTQARSLLKTFKTNNPSLYPKVVQYRLSYLSEKITDLNSKPQPAPTPKQTTVNPPAPVTAPGPVVAVRSNAVSNTNFPAPKPPAPVAAQATIAAPLAPPAVVRETTNVALLPPKLETTTVPVLTTTPTPTPAPTPAPPVAVTPVPELTAPPSTPAPAKEVIPSGADLQIKSLQEQIRNYESDKTLLEAKLKEALSARPAAADPRELARAQSQIKELQKENELLKFSLAEAKTNAVQGNPAALDEVRRTLEEANRKLAQLTEANANLAMEKNALEARFKSVTASSDPNNAALREENAILKKQLAGLKEKEAASPQGGDLGQKLQEVQSQLAVLQSEEQIWHLEKAALENQIRQRGGTMRSTNEQFVATILPNAAANDASADKIRLLEAQVAELERSLATASKLSSGSKKTKEMASHVTDMTREMVGLRARIDILEARPIPYTQEELALLTKPGATTLVAEAVHHSATAKVNKEPSGKLAVLLAEAKQYWVAHDLEKAEQKYHDTLKLDPNNVSLLADLASIQSDRGNAVEAEVNLKKALSNDPNDDYSLFVLGILKLRQEKYDDSLESFSRAAQINPQNAKIQNYIGITLSEKGVRGPAEAAFRKAIQIDPSYADAHANLAFVYLTQKPPLVELAHWHYRKALDAGHAPDLSMEKLFEQAKTASATH